jgi:hypothetical protein
MPVGSFEKQTEMKLEMQMVYCAAGAGGGGSSALERSKRKKPNFSREILQAACGSGFGKESQKTMIQM